MKDLGPQDSAYGEGDENYKIESLTMWSIYLILLEYSNQNKNIWDI